VQVDPIRPTLKLPGTRRLKLNDDAPLSVFAFNFELRRYIEAIQAWIFRGVQATDAAAASTDPKESDRMRVGRQRLDFGQVGRCRLTLCNPR